MILWGNFVSICSILFQGLLDLYILRICHVFGSLHQVTGMTSETTLSDTTSNETTASFDLMTSETTDLAEETSSYVNDLNTVSNDQMSLGTINSTNYQSDTTTEPSNLNTLETTDSTEETTNNQSDATTESSDLMTSESTDTSDFTSELTTATALNKNASIEFFFVPEDLAYIEMFAGMRANVSIAAEFGSNIYNQSTLKLGDDRLEHIDIGSIECTFGKSIKSENQTRLNKSYYFEIGFRRDSMLGYGYHMMNVSRESVSKEDRQVICNFVIFLHNVNGLTDGQTISLKAGLEVTTLTESLSFEKNLWIIANTSTLTMKKVAKCEMNSTALRGEKLRAITIPIQCWIPYYQPNIKIIVEDASITRNSENFLSSYVELQSIGDNFTPGAESHILPTYYRFPVKDPGSLTFSLSSNWVNREYLYTNETSNKDLLTFKVGVILSQSTSTGDNYTCKIYIYLNATLEANISVVITAVEPSSNETTSISLYSNETNELFPFKQSSVFLQISIPSGQSGSMDMDVYSESQSVLDKSILIIKIITILNKTATIFGSMSALSHPARNFSVETVNHFTLYFTNMREGYTGLITICIKFEFNPSHAKFGAASNVVVRTHKEFKYPVILNKPEILLDKFDKISSQVYHVLDGNITTCMELPVNGEIPPLLWMKMKTVWLNINMTSYNITIVGDEIHCRQHGGRNIQVSYSTTRSGIKIGSINQVTFCTLISDIPSQGGRMGECGFRCDCSGQECEEINLVMANNEQSKWSLCEISASNLN